LDIIVNNNLPLFDYGLLFIYILTDFHLLVYNFSAIFYVFCAEMKNITFVMLL